MRSDSGILVTGATGFVGRAVINELAKDSHYRVRGAARRLSTTEPLRTNVAIGELGPATNWQIALANIDTVVHTAARVHAERARVPEDLADYRRVNTEATLALARRAAEAGVRRFVFLSSVKVNGESTPIDKAFTADDRPNPNGPYAISKAEAEAGLRRLEQETGLEVVIIRPVLVYGPGVRANFLSMMRWIERGVPLPLGSVENARSLVALDNLVDLITVCVRHPGARGQTFMISDGEDLSTPELLRRTGDAMGRRARLVPVPVFVLRSGAKILGKAAVAERLCASLRVDISTTRSRLSWTPPTSVDQGLSETVRSFINGKSHVA
jgi:nucleoside-diphosphate-sugar epimerase